MQKIVKISKIKNFGIYKDFEWDSNVKGKDGEPLTFNYINVFYGRNYSGKTTLSRMFRCLEIGKFSAGGDDAQFEFVQEDGNIISSSLCSDSPFPIRVFNADFRRENLAFLTDTSHDGVINPFAVLGDDNVQVHERIFEVENKLGSNEAGKETGLYAKRANLKLNLDFLKKSVSVKKKDIEKKKRGKATVDSDSIKQCAHIYGNVRYNVQSLESDIRTVLSNQSEKLSEDDKNKYLDCVRENKKEIQRTVEFSAGVFSSLIEKTRQVLLCEIGQSGKIEELIKDCLLNEWVRKGKQYHEERHMVRCCFCGCAIPEERWKQLQRHFDEESELLRNRLIGLIEEVKTYKRDVEQISLAPLMAFYFSLHKAIKPVQERIDELKRQHLKAVESIIEKIKIKISNLMQPYQLGEFDDSSEDLEKEIAEYNKFVNKSNLITVDKEKDIEKARRKLRLNEVLSFIILTDYERVMEEITSEEKKVSDEEIKLADIEREIDDAKNEILELKQQLQDVSKGANKVNSYLSHLDGLSLKLVAQSQADGKQVYFKVERNGKAAFNLSEGECSIIAFCYFMARLDDIHTENTKPIIYLDDPICSLDTNHIFFVYSLIRDKLTKKEDFLQLFISTHSLEFLKYLKRLSKKQPNSKKYDKAWFIIERKGEHSSIMPMPDYMREYVTEFEYLFAQIYKCAHMKTVDDSNYSVFYNFGNNARKFLEIYVYFKRPTAPFHDVLESLFSERVYALLVDRFNNEMSHLSGSLERGSQPMDYVEERLVAQLILKGIEDEDKEQYNSLVARMHG